MSGFSTCAGVRSSTSLVRRAAFLEVYLAYYCCQMPISVTTSSTLAHSVIFYCIPSVVCLDVVNLLPSCAIFAIPGESVYVFHPEVASTNLQVVHLTELQKVLIVVISGV